MKLFNKKNKCIVCEKKVDEGIEKHDQIFCSEECLKKFHENMEELEGMSLDDCC